MLNPSKIQDEYAVGSRLFDPEVEAFGARCRECGMLPGECYFICSNSPNYYSAEREREDSDYNDSLPYDVWFSEAVRQYEQVHGEPYCS
jgi:hypothetical protein